MTSASVSCVPLWSIPTYKAMAWGRRNAQDTHRRTGFQWIGQPRLDGRVLFETHNRPRKCGKLGR